MLISNKAGCGHIFLSNGRCSSDLADEQRQRLRPWVPVPKPVGRPAARLTSVPDCLSLLPHSNLQRLHNKRRQRVRQQAGKTPQPSAAILCTQSVKTWEQGGPRGYMREKVVCQHTIPLSSIAFRCRKDRKCRPDDSTREPIPKSRLAFRLFVGLKSDKGVI